jgi:hypothetical protein
MKFLSFLFAFATTHTATTYFATAQSNDSSTTNTATAYSLELPCNPIIPSCNGTWVCPDSTNGLTYVNDYGYLCKDINNIIALPDTILCPYGGSIVGDKCVYYLDYTTGYPCPDGSVSMVRKTSTAAQCIISTKPMCPAGYLYLPEEKACVKFTRPWCADLTSVSPSPSMTLRVIERPSESASMTLRAIEKPSESASMTPKIVERPSESASITPKIAEKPSESASMTLRAIEQPSESASMTPKIVERPSESASMTPKIVERPSESASITPKIAEEPSASPSPSCNICPPGYVYDTTSYANRQTCVERISKVRVSVCIETDADGNCLKWGMGLGCPTGYVEVDDTSCERYAEPNLANCASPSATPAFTEPLVSASPTSECIKWICKDNIELTYTSLFSYPICIYSRYDGIANELGYLECTRGGILYGKICYMYENATAIPCDGTATPSVTPRIVEKPSESTSTSASISSSVSTRVIEKPSASVSASVRVIEKPSESTSASPSTSVSTRVIEKPSESSSPIYKQSPIIDYPVSASPVSASPVSASPVSASPVSASPSSTCGHPICPDPYVFYTDPTSTTRTIQCIHKETPLKREVCIEEDADGNCLRYETQLGCSDLYTLVDNECISIVAPLYHGCTHSPSPTTSAINYIRGTITLDIQSNTTTNTTAFEDPAVINKIRDAIATLYGVDPSRIVINNIQWISQGNFMASFLIPTARRLADLQNGFIIDYTILDSISGYTPTTTDASISAATDALGAVLGTQVTLRVPSAAPSKSSADGLNVGVAAAVAVVGIAIGAAMIAGGYIYKKRADRLTAVKKIMTKETFNPNYQGAKKNIADASSTFKAMTSPSIPGSIIESARGLLPSFKSAFTTAPSALKYSNNIMTPDAPNMKWESHPNILFKHNKNKTEMAPIYAPQSMV